jgi:8-oxo-dGTP pyrophosphatase MutT (NUDIX family)
VTLHADALATLRGWSAADPEQVDLRGRFVAHLEAHPDGLSRDCRPDHVTAGVVVLSSDLDRVLLNLHRKAQQWFHFGGHCEPGDSTLAGAALREGLEESGLRELDLTESPVELSEHAVPFCAPGQVVHHLDVRYAARVAADHEPAVSDESLAVRWWPLDTLPPLQEEMLVLIRRAHEALGAAPSQPGTQPSVAGSSLAEE